MRTTRGSSRPWGGCASLHAGIQPPGVGLETPQARPFSFPLGVGLETPSPMQGILGYHLQGMQGYQPPLPVDTRYWKYYLAPNFVCGR